MSDKKNLIQRAEKILNNPIRVFYNESFDTGEENILGPMPGAEKYEKGLEKNIRQRSQGNVAPELYPCYEGPLLTREQELHLFRQMNYYKWRAKKLVDSLDPKRPSKRLVVEIEFCLERATEVRNRIARSNFRLATHILKTQKNFRENGLIQSLLQDAYTNVVRAVDYFDYNLGHKFSTYCIWVIRRNYFRDVTNYHRVQDRFCPMDEGLENTLLVQNEEDTFVSAESNSHLLKKLFKLLNPREAYILDQYFGINGPNKTLDEISAKVGVTKERVRQLKQKAIKSLKQKAEELNISYDPE